MTMIGLKVAMSGANETQHRINQVVSGMGVAIRKTAFQEAHLLRRTIVMGIRKQAPGGETFEPLAPETIKRKGSSKALIDHGDLIRSVNVKEIGGGIAYFVGVHKEARSADGKSLANIAEVHEFGTRNKRIPARPYLRPSFKVWKKGIQLRMITRIAYDLGLNRAAQFAGSRMLTDSTNSGFNGNLSADFSRGKLNWRIS